MVPRSSRVFVAFLSVVASSSKLAPEPNNNVKLSMLKKLESDSEEDMSYKVSFVVIAHLLAWKMSR